MASPPLNLLLVDDDEGTAFLFRLVLQKIEGNARLQVAEGGQQAMDYLAGKGQYWDRNLYPLPDLVVLDLIMPGVSGLDVLDWRRKMPAVRKIPVLVFSGSLDQRDQESALAKGAARFLPKPVDSSGFRSAIEEIVRFGRQVLAT